MHASRRVFALLIAVAALPLAACGAPGSRPDASGPEGGSIRVWIMEPGSARLRSFIEKATSEFQGRHPDSKVKVQFVPWAQAHDQFVTAIGGGQVPDLAEMGTTWTPEFAAAGALAPTGEGVKDVYVPSLVESATVNGKVYGLPWYAGARALIYRSDVLERLGLEPPSNWGDLVDVGRAIRDRTDLYPFGVTGTGWHYFLPMVWQNGGQIAELTRGRWVSRMDSPAAVEAIRFYAELYTKERFAPEGALSWNARDVRAAFEAGDLAMMIGGAWDVRAILDAQPELEGKVATTLLPEGPGGSRDSFAGGSHLVVFRESRQKQLARDFGEFLIAPERVSAFAQELGFLPGSLKGLDASGSSREDLYAPFATQFRDHSRTYPPAKQWGGFEGTNGVFVSAVQQIMQGKRPAAEAMAEVAEKMNQAFHDR